MLLARNGEQSVRRHSGNEEQSGRPWRYGDVRIRKERDSGAVNRDSRSRDLRDAPHGLPCIVNPSNPKGEIGEPAINCEAGCHRQRRRYHDRERAVVDEYKLSCPATDNGHYDAVGGPHQPPRYGRSTSARSFTKRANERELAQHCDCADHPSGKRDRRPPARRRVEGMRRRPGFSRSRRSFRARPRSQRTQTGSTATQRPCELSRVVSPKSTATRPAVAAVKATAYASRRSRAPNRLGALVNGSDTCLKSLCRQSTKGVRNAFPPVRRTGQPGCAGCARRLWSGLVDPDPSFG